MKKYFMIGAIAIACTFTQTAKAQSFLQKLLEAAATTAATSSADMITIITAPIILPLTCLTY